MFENIDIEKVKEELRNYSTNYKENFAKIEKFIESEIQEILNLKKNNKSILFEGAQGISLDVDHGIYPYTTSSNTAAGHISTGTGVSFRDIGRITSCL